MLTIQLAALVPQISAGRGWIALVAIYLGNRTPWGIVAASFVFGLAGALPTTPRGQGRSQRISSSALPYLITVVAMILYAVWRHARTSK